MHMYIYDIWVSIFMQYVCIYLNMRIVRLWLITAYTYIVPMYLRMYAWSTCAHKHACEHMNIYVHMNMYEHVYVRDLHVYR